MDSSITLSDLERKPGGRALFLEDQLKMYQKEDFWPRKVLERVVCMEIQKALKHGRRKSISLLKSARRKPLDLQLSMRLLLK